MTDVTGTGMKFDKGKLRWDLIQPLIVQAYVDVLTHGAEKYAPNSWRTVKDRRNRYFAALMRHIWKWWLGERDDPEWGIHHLGHAMCNIAFLAEPELEKLVACPHLHTREFRVVGAQIPEHWCYDCERVLKSAHGLYTDSGRVREPDSPGPGGSGGSEPGEGGTA